MARTRDSSISPAMEDYLKAIHQIAEEADGGAVTTQALADRLRISTASVTGMVKRLDALRLVRHERYHGVRLTPRGEAVALEVLRHHRLLELYLVEQLGMGWDEVHAEADRLEHHISEGLEDAIAEKLGQPRRDPHGDPIPARDGTIVDEPSAPLPALAAGGEAPIVRVASHDPALLQYLAERGLVPGARVGVEAVDVLAGILRVRVGTAEHVLALPVAASIRIAAT